MAERGETRRAVLAMLTEAGEEGLSGAGMARRLGCSRTSVFKAVRGLVREGFGVERVPDGGYRLAGAPESLSASSILPRLETAWLGREWRHLATVDSTNSHAMRLVAGGAPHGTVVVAEAQTAGRGRLGRAWHSPPGAGLSLSMLLRPPVSVPEAPLLGLCAALALVRVLRRDHGLSALLKWPNDVLVSGRKAAGVLAEALIEEDRVLAAVVGVGVNVNGAPAGPLRFPATSLAVETGRTVSRAAVAAALVCECERVFTVYFTEGFAGLHEEAGGVLAFSGQAVSVARGGDELRGVAAGLSGDGALRLVSTEGREHTVTFGDVTPRRC